MTEQRTDSLSGCGTYDAHALPACLDRGIMRDDRILPTTSKQPSSLLTVSLRLGSANRRRMPTQHSGKKMEHQHNTSCVHVPIVGYCRHVHAIRQLCPTCYSVATAQQGYSTDYPPPTTPSHTGGIQNARFRIFKLEMPVILDNASTRAHTQGEQRGKGIQVEAV